MATKLTIETSTTSFAYDIIELCKKNNIAIHIHYHEVYEKSKNASLKQTEYMNKIYDIVNGLGDATIKDVVTMFKKLHGVLLYEKTATRYLQRLYMQKKINIIKQKNKTGGYKNIYLVKK